MSDAPPMNDPTPSAPPVEATDTSGEDTLMTEAPTEATEIASTVEAPVAPTEESTTAENANDAAVTTEEAPVTEEKEETQQVPQPEPQPEIEEEVEVTTATLKPAAEEEQSPAPEKKEEAPAPEEAPEGPVSAPEEAEVATAALEETPSIVSSPPKSPKYQGRGVSWDERLEDMKEYCKTHPDNLDLRGPDAKREYRDLALWLANQRTKCKQKKLARDKAEALGALGCSGFAVTSLKSPPATSAEPAPKRQKTDTSEEEEEEEDANDGEIADICAQIGYKAGDRLEVEWELETDSDKHINKWWGCTIQEWDGRHQEGVAIRVLDYDPYPEGGFPERSQEDVQFLGHDLMISPDEQDEYRFRSEGQVQFRNEEEARAAINDIIMATMDKHKSKFSKLDRAQQSTIASDIGRKKELLVEAIMQHSRSAVINADDMKNILQGVMQQK